MIPMAATAFPSLDRVLGALDHLHGRSAGPTQARLGEARALLEAAGEWGEMVRETGAVPGALTSEEAALMALLEGGSC